LSLFSFLVSRSLLCHSDTHALTHLSITRHQLPNHDYPQARHLRQQEQGHRCLLCRRHRDHNRSLLGPSKHSDQPPNNEAGLDGSTRRLRKVPEAGPHED
ncbi:unnamed protein product, partial [Ectocarpus sp. 8 AP-2014]